MITKCRIAGIALAALGLMLPPGLEAQTRTAATHVSWNGSDEPLAPGDVIRLTFWREPDLTGEYNVDEAGFAVLPILGVRNVTDLPTTVLKQRLLQDYAEQLRNQEVQITMLRRVRILGAVREPGLYHLDGTMTLADAVALAGGATPTGKVDKVQLFRSGQRLDREFDLVSPVLRQVRSGDQMLIPERSWLSRHAPILIGSFVSATAIIVARVVTN